MNYMDGHNSRDAKDSFADELRQNPTKGELALRDELQELGFEFQYVIGTYIADFAHSRHYIVVEIDGYSHIGREEYDARRDYTMRQAGWVVLRFRDEAARKAPGRIIAIVLTVLRHRRELADLTVAFGCHSDLYEFAQREAGFTDLQMRQALDTMGLDRDSLWQALHGKKAPERIGGSLREEFEAQVIREAYERMDDDEQAFETFEEARAGVYDWELYVAAWLVRCVAKAAATAAIAATLPLAEAQPETSYQKNKRRSAEKLALWKSREVIEQRDKALAEIGRIDVTLNGFDG